VAGGCRSCEPIAVHRRPARRITPTVADAAGLKVGDDVRIAGVKGRHRDLAQATRRDGPRSAVVDSGMQVGDNSRRRIKIKTRSARSTSHSHRPVKDFCTGDIHRSVGRRRRST